MLKVLQRNRSYYVEWNKTLKYNINNKWHIQVIIIEILIDKDIIGAIR